MSSSRVPVSAKALVASFFASGPVVSHPTIRSRAPRVHRHLDIYLDTEGERYLGHDDLVLLDAQRQLDPVDAVLSVGGPSLLLQALPGFCQTAWLLPDAADARAQLWTVLALRDWIARAVPEADSAELHHRVLRAVRTAHGTLDGARHS